MPPLEPPVIEEGRAFFQQRVAPFAKVMIGAQALGRAGLLAL